MDLEVLVVERVEMWTTRLQKFVIIRKIKGKTENFSGGQPPFLRWIILWTECGLVENLS